MKNKILFYIAFVLLFVMIAEIGYLFITQNYHLGSTDNSDTVSDDKLSKFVNNLSDPVNEEIQWGKKNMLLREKGAINSSILIQEIEGVLKELVYHKGVVGNFNYVAVLKLVTNDGTIIPFYFNKNEFDTMRYIDSGGKLSLKKLEPGTRIIMTIKTDQLKLLQGNKDSTKEIIINKKTSEKIS